MSTAIPEQLIKRITQLEDHFNTLPGAQESRKIVAFDMDNTLLIHDIGEALFAQLKVDEQSKPVTIDGSMIPMSWEEYRQLVAKNKKKEAYTGQVSALAGIPVSSIIQTTKRIMDNPGTSIEADGQNVFVPSPNPVMKALVDYLRSLNYEIYVISASQQLSVQYVAKKYFGIEESQVIGMQNRLEETDNHGQVLMSELEEPLTVGDGKADAYQVLAGNMQPLITAGDSTTDLPVLNLTYKEGIIIWVGKDESKLQWMKDNTHYPETIYFLKRD